MATKDEAPPKDTTVSEETKIKDSVAENAQIKNVQESCEAETTAGLVVKDSDWVVWDVNGDKQAFVQAKPCG